jgi:hypothetical protein
MVASYVGNGYAWMKYQVPMLFAGSVINVKEKGFVRLTPVTNVINDRKLRLFIIS